LSGFFEVKHDVDENGKSDQFVYVVIPSRKKDTSFSVLNADKSNIHKDQIKENPIDPEQFEIGEENYFDQS
jgi:hypothetical protein